MYKMHKKKKEGEREQDPLLALFLLPCLGEMWGSREEKKEENGVKEGARKGVNMGENDVGSEKEGEEVK